MTPIKMNDLQSTLAHLLFRVTVTGESMWPALTPGKTYWASSLLPYRVGAIVVAKTNHRFVIKRVGAMSGESVELESEAPGGATVTVPRMIVLGTLLFRSRRGFGRTR